MDNYAGQQEDGPLFAKTIALVSGERRACADNRAGGKAGCVPGDTAGGLTRNISI
jgi:hypothetical protein